MGRNAHAAKRLWGEMSFHGANCPWGEMSVGRKVHKLVVHICHATQKYLKYVRCGCPVCPLREEAISAVPSARCLSRLGRMGSGTIHM